MNSHQYSPSDKQNLSFSLTNDWSEVRTILKWRTPFEGIKSNLFWVKRAEEKAVYLGRLVKRGIPKSDEYVSLGAGESISTDLEITSMYDISKAGIYTIQETEVTGKRSYAPNELKSERITSNVYEFNLLQDRAAKTSQGALIGWKRPLAD